MYFTECISEKYPKRRVPRQYLDNNIYKPKIAPLFMPEKDFDIKYGIDSDKAEVKSFHSSRRMFAIKDDKLFFANPNISYTHARWFELRGWIKGTDDSIMNTIVRGYIDNDGVYFYKGYDMNVDAQSEQVMAAHLEELVERIAVDGSKHLYGGIIKQDAPGKWPPRIDYGTISDYLKN